MTIVLLDLLWFDHHRRIASEKNAEFIAGLLKLLHKPEIQLRHGLGNLLRHFAPDRYLCDRTEPRIDNFLDAESSSGTDGY